MRFSKTGDLVIDPMCGSGTTLGVARTLGRDAIGCDISEDLTKRVVQGLQQTAQSQWGRTEVMSGNAASDLTVTRVAELMTTWGHESCAMQIFHPPYHDIIRFTDVPGDLSACPTVDDFLISLDHVFRRWLPLLRKGGIIGVVIGDLYASSAWVPLGFRVLELLQSRDLGLSLRGIVVKNMTNSRGKRNMKNLWRYRSLQNDTFLFAHEYILVLKKK